MAIKNKATRSERNERELETEASKKLRSTNVEGANSAMKSEESRSKDSSDDNESDDDRQLKFVLKRQWDMIRALAKAGEERKDRAFREEKLRSYGWTLEELAEKFNVSTKTIKRDLKSISYVFGNSAIKTRNEAHGRKRYYIEASNITFGLSLNRDELLAIYVAQTLTSPLRGTKIWEDLQKSREKIKDVLTDETVKYAERVAPFFYRFDPTELHYSKEMRTLIDKTLEAMIKGRALQIKYRSLKSLRSKTYEIDPYNFIYWGNAIYLIGFCRRDKKVKVWKVDRLSGAELLEARKSKRSTFDVEKYLSNSVMPFVTGEGVCEVTIRFTGYAARIVEEERLRSIQSVTTCKSGAKIVVLKTETGKMFFRWLLGFGAHAEILSPLGLRRNYLSELQSIQTRYEDSGDEPVRYYEEFERDLEKRLEEEKAQRREADLTSNF